MSFGMRPKTILHTVGAAITSHRVLGPAEARIMFIVARLLLPLTVVAFSPRDSRTLALPQDLAGDRHLIPLIEVRPV